MLVSWLLRSMDLKLAASIPFHDDVERLWEYLEKRFCVTNGLRLQQLRAAIVDCKQQCSITIEAYFTKLMGLYDELNRLKPLHGYVCNLFTCNFARIFATDRDEEKIHQFLIGLDDEIYGTPRSNILSQSPPEDLDRIYQILTQEERSRDIARGKAIKEEVHAFTLQTDRSRSRLGRTDQARLTSSHGKTRRWRRTGVVALDEQS